MEYFIQFITWLIISILSKLTIYYCILFPFSDININWVKSLLYIFTENVDNTRYLITIPFNLLLNLIQLLLLYYNIRGTGIIDEITFNNIDNINDVYNEL